MKNEMSYKKCYDCGYCAEIHIVRGLKLLCRITGKSINMKKCIKERP